MQCPYKIGDWVRPVRASKLIGKVIHIEDIEDNPRLLIQWIGIGKATLCFWKMDDFRKVPAEQAMIALLEE